MRQGASLGQRGWHGYGLQLHADAHEDARALSDVRFLQIDCAYGWYSDLPAQSARHSFNRSFRVIAGAAVSGAKEELTVGFNDGGGHNFESY